MRTDDELVSMSDNLNKAIALLSKESDLRCALVKDDLIYTSETRGVKPLLGFIESGVDFRGFSAADRVLGRAASFLYVKLGVTEIYSDVMSEGAVELLDSYGISHSCRELTDKIINRAGDDICPMDKTVLDITDPDEAYIALKNKVAQMAKGAGPKKMDKKDVFKLVEDIISAGSCCDELKILGRKYLDSIGTADEKALGEVLLAEAEEDVVTVDDNIEFFGSELGRTIFGDAVALQKKEHAEKRKAAGEIYCDCEACSGCLKLLDNRDLILL